MHLIDSTGTRALRRPATRARHFRTVLRSAVLLLFSTSVAEAADDDIRLSTIGYLPDAPKVASVVGTAGSSFALRRTADDTAVLTGDLSAAVTDTDTNQSVRAADFTAVTVPGDYYLEVTDVGRSLSFPIGNDVFTRQLLTAMLGYYGWRSGTAVEF